MHDVCAYQLEATLECLGAGLRTRPEALARSGCDKGLAAIKKGQRTTEN